MLTLTIPDERIQASFDAALNAMLDTTSYQNPVKKVLDDMLGYNGDADIKKQLMEQIKAQVVATMASPQFALALGQAMAAEIAKREVDKLKR